MKSQNFEINLLPEIFAMLHTFLVDGFEKITPIDISYGDLSIDTTLNMSY